MYFFPSFNILILCFIFIYVCNLIIVYNFRYCSMFYSHLASFTYSGGILGTVFMMPLSGWLAATNHGWPLIFYVAGAFSVIWGVLFYNWGWSSPSEHPNISEDEKNYIETSLGRSDRKSESV